MDYQDYMQEDIQERIPTPPPMKHMVSEKVFIRYFRSAQPKFLKHFEEITYGEKTAFSRVAAPMFEKTVQLCKIQADPNELKELKRIFVEVGEVKLGDASVKIEFDQICYIITSWYVKAKPLIAVPQRKSNSIVPNVRIHNSSTFFEAKLCKAILDFESLIKQCPKEKQYTEKIVTCMKGQLDEYRTDNPPKR